MFRLTPVTKNLLLVNVLCFVLQAFLGLPLGSLFAYHNVFSAAFQPYQFVTYMFLHGDGMHLFGNMFALLVFGPLLEQTLGAKRFLIFYFVTGIGAGILYASVNIYEVESVYAFLEEFKQYPNPDTILQFIEQQGIRLNNAGLDFIYDDYPRNPDSLLYHSKAIELLNKIYQNKISNEMVGASGAIFGILMAFGMLFPNLRLMLLFPPIPVRAKYLVIFYAAFEIYAIIEQNPNDNVAHLAHLGGMLFAFILLKIWKIRRQDI